jgi:hypothetical protein
MRSSNTTTLVADAGLLRSHGLHTKGREIRSIEGSMTSAVEEFIAAYTSYFDNEVALDDQAMLLADDEQKRLVERQRLRPNVVGSQLIELLESRVGPVTDDLAEFLKGPGCQWWLDAMLMTLPALGASRGVSQMEEMLALCQPALAPFGVERDGYGLGHYCVDFRPGESRGRVVYCPHPTAEPDQAVSQPLASSLGQMLKVLAALISTEVPWAHLNEEQVAALRAIDPECFGGEAWASWWEPRILG